MSYTTLVPTPPRTAMNTGLSPARPSTLTTIFGPFNGLLNDCSGACQNPTVSNLLETRNVGPFNVTGIRPAVAALEGAFDEVKAAHPVLWDMLGTEGMFCYRHISGSQTVSNHAAGIAIDLKLDNILPAQGAGQIPMGFVVLYGYFHRRGFYWGAGYRTLTDPMHFEVADETLKLWHAQGKI